MKKLLSAVAAALRVTSVVLAVMTAVVAFVSLLAHDGVFSPESPLFIADFISPLWLCIPLLAAGILALIGGGRLFWIPVAGAGLFFLLYGDISLGALGGALSQQAMASRHTLRAVTLNVEYYAQGVDAVMDAIDRLDADVVFLGEHVLSTGQYMTMQKRLNGRTLVAGHPNSTALISRLPVVWWKEVELPSHEASLSGGNDPDEVVKHPHRSFIHAVVRSDSQYVHVISVRFVAGRPKDHSLPETLRWSAFMFREQTEESEFFARYVSGLKGPVIFGGDLNACPEARTVARLRAVATDAYMANNVFGDFTFRVEFPTMRIDYLFCMNGVSSVAASRPRVIVSDHFPVLATFALGPAGTGNGRDIIPASYGRPAPEN